jgi:RND superfamily putative drug exporter
VRPTSDREDRGRDRSGRRNWGLAYARAIGRLRWVIIVAWVMAAVSALVWMPEQEDSGTGFEGMLTQETPAIQTELRSLDTFGFPLLARTTLVQRDPDGLSVYDQARTATNAAALNQGDYPDVSIIRGAIPLSNSLELFPGARETGTTALTYLFVDPTASVGRQRRTALRYADRYFSERDSAVGVTGSVPARAEQGGIITDKLPLVETWTLVAILSIVGIAFRSLVAPLLTVAVTGVGYLMTLLASSTAAKLFDLPTPTELRPVVVAMLLGVTTDYVVFLVSSLRQECAESSDAEQLGRAVERATARSAHIVAAAGLAVAAGSAVLVVAKAEFFRALAAPLVITVMIALMVCLTLLPALLAVIGRAVFWPGRGVVGASPLGGRPRLLEALARRISGDRQIAGMVLVACVMPLLAAATPVLRMDLGVSFVASLPADTPVRRAAAAAQQGFADGILSPTMVLVEGDGIVSDRAALRALGDQLQSQPGVAGVLGPSDLPVSRRYNVFLAANGDAVRYLVVFSDQPLGAAAIGHFNALEGDLPQLLTASGLPGARVGLGGDTAAASYIVRSTQDDLLRIGLAALLVNFLILLVFLRAAVASLYLLATSLLSVAATLGLTTTTFEAIAPGQGLTFYVPFAAAVLLLAFGSDYNVFSVGKVWDEAKDKSLPDALAAAMPPTTRALAAAGLALAASFGVLAIVPLLPFRQLAFAMGLGIFLDVFVVRLLLVPTLLSVVGARSAWPSDRFGGAASMGEPQGLGVTRRSGPASVASQ